MSPLLRLIVTPVALAERLLSTRLPDHLHPEACPSCRQPLTTFGLLTITEPTSEEWRCAYCQATSLWDATTRPRTLIAWDALGQWEVTR